MSDALDDYDLEGTDTEVDAGDSHGGDQSSSDTPSKPDALSVKPEAIPDKLKSRDQWVCWRYERRDDWTKPPLDAANGSYASTSDSSSWSSFTDALDYHERGETDTDGIGFVVHDGDMVAGLDLDDCRWPDEDEREEWAGRILDEVPTYAEVSPSGTGYRLIGLASLPDGGNRDDIEDAEGHIEAYDSGRFLTMTGHHVDGTREDIHEVNDEFAEVHERHIADSSDSADNETRAGDSADANPTPEGAKTGLDDDEVVQRAKNAEGGQRFADLWNGRTVSGLDGNGGQSERDLALVNDLAFWTGGDRSQMDRLFRKSGLMRDKWDRDDYREGTIDKALDGRTDFYGTDTRGEERPQPKTMCLSDLPLLDHEGNARSMMDQRQEAVEILNRDNHYVAAMPETSNVDGTILHRYEDGSGHFKPGADAWIRRKIRSETDVFEGRSIKEIVSHIRDLSFARRDTFDAGRQDGTLINLANGVYDLDGNTLMDHSPEYRFMTSIPTEYDEDAQCPNIDSFIESVVDDEKERQTLYEWAGFCLEAGYPVHRFLILHGSGRNGKSVYFRLLTELLGKENKSGVTLDTIADGGFGVGSLEDSMLNVDTESADTRLGPAELNTLKALTGGDDRQVNVKYIEPYDMRNAAKLAFAANHPPRFDEETDAIADRLLAIEFPHRFKENHEEDAEADREAIPEEKLMASLTTDEELSGFLNKALEGLRRVRERGYFSLEEDTTSRERFEAYQRDADSIVGFARTCLKNHTKMALPKDVVYNLYKVYCENNDHTPAERSAFFRQLWRKSDLEQHNERPGIPNDKDGYDRPFVLDRLWLTNAGRQYVSPPSRKAILKVIGHMHDGNRAMAVSELKDGKDTEQAEIHTSAETVTPQSDRIDTILDVVERESRDEPADKTDIVNSALDEGIEQHAINETLQKLVNDGPVCHDGRGYYLR